MLQSEQADRLLEWETMEQGLKEDFEYFKRQGYNKIYLTELFNCIFSMNHQFFNILLVDYFEKKFQKEITDIIDLDKMAFFSLRPDRHIIEYVNNEFALADLLEKEIAELEVKLGEVMGFITEAKAAHQLTPEMIEIDGSAIDPAKVEFEFKQELKRGSRLPTKYELKVEELREFCKRVVIHGMQSVRWQEMSKERFEKLVEELKVVELEEWDIKQARKNALRAYKDMLSRVKNRLRNLYRRRFEKDIHIFKLGDHMLLDISDHFSSYLNQFSKDLREKSFNLKNIDFKEAIIKFYQENFNIMEEDVGILMYSPEWPPFREYISNPKFFFGESNKRRIHQSFAKLLDSFDKCLTEKEQGIDKFFFDTVDGVLNKINNMVLFLVSRLEPLVLTEEVKQRKDSHQMTVMYIEHFERVLRKTKDLYHMCICEGPLRKYLRNMFEKTEDNEKKNKLIREPFEELKYRLYANPKAYETQEFWSDLSMRVYLFSQKLFAETVENNFVKAYLEMVNGVIENVQAISQEILEFNGKQILHGILETYPTSTEKAKKKKLTKQNISDFLSEAGSHADLAFELKEYIDDDNADFDNYLQMKYLDARQKIYEVYLANRFTELYRIEPVHNFTRVTFLDTREEFYLNIPAYFKVTVEEHLQNKPPKFLYVHFPAKDPKTIPLAHVNEDEPLKAELDREFKYFSQIPEELKWEQIYSKFFEKLTLEQYINLLLRDRTILHQGRYYDNVDQIALTQQEGSGITKPRTPQVSTIEDIMKKGFGYAKYSMGTKRKLPIPIPFSSGDITSESVISMYLLSIKHLVVISKTSSEGIPMGDAFRVLVAVDAFEQTNGVEVKWSLAIQWTKSSWLKSIVEGSAPGEAKKNIMDWSQIAEEVIRTNKPEEEATRPDIVELDIEKANYRQNPVFQKKIEPLNVKAAVEEEEEERPKDKLEIFKENFQFEKAKENAIAYGIKSAQAKGPSDDMDTWEIIPRRHKAIANEFRIKEKVEESFDGIEFIEKLDELDQSDKRKAYFVLTIVAIGFLFRLFF